MKLLKNYIDILRTQKEVYEWLREQGIGRNSAVTLLPWSHDSVHTGEERVAIDFKESSQLSKNDSYTLIHDSRHCKIYERIQSERQLRNGLTDNEKTVLLQYVRSILLENFKTGSFKNSANSINENFSSKLLAEKCVVDVAWYVDGLLRGSIVANQGTLLENVVSATEGLVSDSRFKPVTSEEFERATVEISIAAGPWVTLSEHDYKTDRSYHNMMHRVVVNGVVRGWYVPMVTSLPGFDTERKLVSSLGSKKANLSQSELKNAQYQIAAAETFHACPLQMHIGSSVDSFERFEETLLEHIVSKVDDGGFVAVVTDPYHKDSFVQFDAVRSAATWLTLQEYLLRRGNTLNINEISKRIQLFLHELETQMSDSKRDMVNVYLRSTDTQLTKKTNDSLRLLQWIRSKQFMCPHRVPSENYVSVLQSVYEEWIKTKEHCPLAAYADLAPALTYEGQHDESLLVQEWYKELQNSDGSFPNVPHSNFVYTRGTSKIAESLALIPESEEVVTHALKWLLSMRYSHGNMYHIPKSEWPSLVNGIRHDYWNKAVWLDSACHTILALIRLSDAQKGNTLHLQMLSQ